MARNVHKAWKIIGPGPWSCHFCKGEITKRGRGSNDCHAHHIDGDKTNDVMGNVVPAHGRCHHQHHYEDFTGFAGHTHSEDTKARMSASRKGTNHRPPGTYQHTEEVKQKISENGKGRKKPPRTAEHTAKFVAARRSNAAKRGKTW